MTHAGKLPQTLLGLLLLSHLNSCTQLPVHSPSTGSLRFQLAFPTNLHPAQTDFALKAIPTATRSFEIQISGSGLSTPKTVQLTATAGESQKTHTIGDLPVGPKRVRVTAFDQNKALASATQDVTITASQTSRAVFDLRTMLFAIEVRLPRAVPMAIPVQAKVSGENVLGAGLNLMGSFAAGSNSLILNDLPEGKKQLGLTVQFNLNGLTFTSETINKEVTGKAEETARIELSFNEIANALVPALLKQKPANLSNLLNLIPAELVEFLRNHPLLAVLLNTSQSAIPSAIPSVLPRSQPTPSAEPSPIPTPQSTAAPELKLEILDGRVVTRPLMLLRDTVDSLSGGSDPEVHILQPSADLQVALGQKIHAAVVRLNYIGEDQPEVNIQIRNLDNPKAPINDRVFPTAVTVKGRLPNRYNALILMLQEDGTPPTLDTLATYRITVTAQANQGRNVVRAAFRVKVI